MPAINLVQQAGLFKLCLMLFILEMVGQSQWKAAEVILYEAFSIVQKSQSRQSRIS